ncbi:MAG: hypothetical protein V3V33_08540 [Candidatus Lokiarchaeia archaeon]
MVKVTILERNKDFLIKEIRYKKARFNRKFRDKTVILAYVNENLNNILNNRNLKEIENTDKLTNSFFL